MRPFIVALLALCTSAAHAALVGGVKLDDQIVVGGKDLVLNGAGMRTRLMLKVYVASLYVPKRANDAAAVLISAPRRIQLNLLRNLSPDQLVDALIQGLRENNSPQEMAALARETGELTGIMKSFPEVKEGDVVALDFADDATTIRLNREVRGTIGGEAFNKALIRIWLGDKPVQADLKEALLGR